MLQLAGCGPYNVPQPAGTCASLALLDLRQLGLHELWHKSGLYIFAAAVSRVSPNVAYSACLYVLHGLMHAWMRTRRAFLHALHACIGLLNSHQLIVEQAPIVAYSACLHVLLGLMHAACMHWGHAHMGGCRRAHTLLDVHSAVVQAVQDEAVRRGGHAIPELRAVPAGFCLQHLHAAVPDAPLLVLMGPQHPRWRRLHLWLCSHGKLFCLKFNVQLCGSGPLWKACILPLTC